MRQTAWTWVHWGENPSRIWIKQYYASYENLLKPNRTIKGINVGGKAKLYVLYPRFFSVARKGRWGKVTF